MKSRSKTNAHIPKNFKYKKVLTKTDKNQIYQHAGRNQINKTLHDNNDFIMVMVFRHMVQLTDEKLPTDKHAGALPAERTSPTCTLGGLPILSMFVGGGGGGAPVRSQKVVSPDLHF